MLESPNFVAGEWRGGEQDADGVIHMPWFDLSAEALAFVRTLGNGGWIFVFDWMSWTDDAKRIVETDELERAGLMTLRKLLTFLVRRNRFVEGTLAEAFETGLFVRILCRLRAIAAAT